MLLQLNLSGNNAGINDPVVVCVETTAATGRAGVRRHGWVAGRTCSANRRLDVVDARACWGSRATANVVRISANLRRSGDCNGSADVGAHKVQAREWTVGISSSDVDVGVAATAQVLEQIYRAGGNGSQPCNLLAAGVGLAAAGSPA